MNRKFIILSLYFFSTICLFSVGFSSWTICMGDKLTASGNIVAEDIMNLDEQYVQFNNSSDLVLDYCETGFVVNNAITNTGQVSVSYTIKVANCINDKVFEENNSVKVGIHLKNTGTFNIYKACDIEYSVSDSSGVIATGNTGKGDFDIYTISFNLNNILDSSKNNGITEYTFIVTYNIKYTDKGNYVDEYLSFRANIYPNLKNVIFNASTYFEGVHYEE